MPDESKTRMKKILLFGAGRSSTHLINYLLEHGKEDDIRLTVVDRDESLVKSKINSHPFGTGIGMEIDDHTRRRELINGHDLIVSLLPVHLHHVVADDCFEIGRHLCTASYVTPEMEKQAQEARAKGLIFMGELGLDPGIDHMSAMECIDQMKTQGAEITAFKSYTGGLVAPESDDNPWHYKVSWNPRNVVLAGKGTATYLYNGRLKYMPYHQVFKRFDLVNIQGMGTYEMYANRNSLLYRRIYDLEHVPTIIRGTLRHRGFCEAWDVLVDLGLTDDSVRLKLDDKHSYMEFIDAFVPDGPGSIRERMARHLHKQPDDEVFNKIEYLGLFSEQKIELDEATPAGILEAIIKDKWKLNPNDRDMIIMQHEFNYSIKGDEQELTSTLVMKGEDATHTAMSRLVGLPLAIFARLVVNGAITDVAMCRPVERKVYQPVLNELKHHGVEFKHLHLHKKELAE